MREVPIIVFARAPVPGQAKTRLAGRLGDWRAARLQARLTVHALRTALAARCGPVELHAAPDERHGFFSYCGRRFPITLKRQLGSGLGERMFRALHGRGAAILIGTDCPALRPDDLRRAARLLQGGYHALVAPAEDGGYVLIATRRVSRRLFDGITWGGADVYSATVQRLSAASYRWRALRRLWDLDRPEDLDRLPALRFAEANRLRSLRSCAAPQRRAPR